MSSHPLNLHKKSLPIQERLWVDDKDPADRNHMWQILAKVVRSPRTLCRLFVDRFCVPWWVHCLGVKVGEGCSFTGHPLITLVPGASITLGDGVRIFSRVDSNSAGLPYPTIIAVLTPRISITIGARTGISGASLVARAGITIGRNVMIGAGACIWDTDFHPLDPHQRREHQTRDASSAPVFIEDDVFIGARALILKGVRIGWGAVIGAGAVVTKNVEACQIVAGNPARIVGAVHPQRGEIMEECR